MKRIFAISLILFLFASCIENGVFEPDANKGYQCIEFGHYDFDNVNISTRSTLPLLAESRIFNLYVFIFNEEGDVIYKQYYDESNRVESESAISEAELLWYVDVLDPENSDPAKRGYTHGSMRLKAPDINNGRLYLLTNLDDDLFDVSRHTLSFIANEDELNDVICMFNEPSTQRMGNFLMVGHTSVKVQGNSIMLGHTFEGDYLFSQDGTSRKALMLKRLDAKIEFKVAIVPGAQTVRTEIINGAPVEVIQEIESFEPQSWQVINLPKGSFLTEHAHDALDDEIDGFFDGHVHSFETDKVVTYNSTTRSEYGFSFYMLENRKSDEIKKSAGGNYHLRDKRNKDSQGAYTPGDLWEYAPEKATYVKITGNIEMSYDNELVGVSQTLHTLATYYIHLGDFSANGFDDYDVARNTHYTYTVNISGVDKIQVEVEKDNERGYNEANEIQSGATGEVFVSQEDIHIFDAHYGQRVFRFNVNDMLRMSEGDVNKLSWYVDSPFGRKGMPARVGASLTDVPNGLDYRWVYFLVNTKEENYVEPHGGIDGGAVTVTNPQYPYACQLNRLWPEGGKNNSELMDVIAFCDYLRKQIKAYMADESNDFDGRGNLYVTVFVDEYYYDIDPISHDRHDALWHYFVNKPMRTMHIMCNSSVSLDGESALIKSAVSIRQLSIQSIYNTESDVALEGWGSETRDELSGNFWFFNRNTENRTENSYQNHFLNENDVWPYSRENGLYNSGQLWGLIRGGAATENGTEWATEVPNKLWNEHLDYIRPNNYISPSDTLELAFMRDDAVSPTLRYSCLMRNRDENGNGIIEKEEIHWYMASVSQLQHLYIGDLGLSGAARLYNLEDLGHNGKSGIEGNDYFVWRNHVVSSTMTNTNGRGTNGGKYRPFIVWSEEGLSLSQYSLDNAWNKPGYYTVRCIRNLEKDSRDGFEMRDPMDYPDHVVEMTHNPDNSYSFDFSRLDVLSKRVMTSTELMPMNENSNMALLSGGFQTGPLADDGVAIGGSSWHKSQAYKTLKTKLEKGISPCPEGYRVPNVREMTVAYMYIPFTDKTFWPSNDKDYLGVCTSYSFGSPDIGGNGYENSTDTPYPNTWYFSPTTITIDPTTFQVFIRCVKDI